MNINELFESIPPTPTHPPVPMPRAPTGAIRVKNNKNQDIIDNKNQDIIDKINKYINDVKPYIDEGVALDYLNKARKKERDDIKAAIRLAKIRLNNDINSTKNARNRKGGRKTNKRKTNKRKTNKRKTNKRKTNKRKTNKYNTRKRKN